MRTHPLELVDLDYVPLKHLSKKTNEVSLFNLAISLYNTQSQFRPSKRKIEYLWVSLRDDHCHIDVKFANRTDVYWTIYKSRKDMQSHWGSEDTFQLGNITVENRRHSKKNRDVIYSYCPTDVQCCQALVEILCNLFVPNELNFYISKKCDVSKILSFNRLNQVNNLTFIVYNEMSDNEFLLFREKVKPKKSLTFNCFLYENQNHGSTMSLNYDSLNLCSAKWLTKEEFARLDCIDLCIKISKLSNEVLNEFMKEWMNGGKSKLETMIVEIENADLKKIMEGIDTKSITAIKKETNLQNKRVDFVFREQFEERKLQFQGDSGRHLIRSDGKIATVDLREDKKFFFMIWNQKTVNITDIPQ